MAELRFVQQMDNDIVEKLEAEMCNREDDLRLEIDNLISNAGDKAVSCVMEEIKKETGWDLGTDESAYSELQTEFEERIRRRMDML